MGVENTDFSPTEAARDAVDRDWWRGAVIYQIYPRSFQDSDGDGTGDLAGITRRLAYVASLGVDAIWISPFFKSPMADFGYDVSDHCDVDPLFGTLGDFDRLVDEAHRLGLKVMIDQVLSHTSAKHPWFAQSRAGRDNPKADWYVWADAKPDGSPPNNWLAIFGGSAWQWDPTRRQYYLHNFLKSQPDLNFHTIQVQDVLLDTVRFWLDRGVDGFRFDTVNFFVHDRELRDNPPLPEERRNASIAPQVNPYNYQLHLYDKNRPENLNFLRRLRALMDSYPAITAVGEVGDDQRGLEIAAQYTSGNDKLQMCYSFDFLSPGPLSGERVVQVVRDFTEIAADGWPCWAFSNHDVRRHASRLIPDGVDTNGYAKILMALLLSLRGSVCLYQGEELGLGEAELAFEDLQDPYGIEFWPEFKGRDGCRTPMVWESRKANAGFSNGRTWLPVSPAHKAIAVDVQEADGASLLNAYRRFLRFRKTHVTLRKGDIEMLEPAKNVVSFFRTHGDDRIFCAFNLSAKTQTVAAPARGLAPLTGHGFSATFRDNVIVLNSGGAFFASAPPNLNVD